jgi:hypothetical protein
MCFAKANIPRGADVFTTQILGEEPDLTAVVDNDDFFHTLRVLRRSNGITDVLQLGKKCDYV